MEINNKMTTFLNRICSECNTTNRDYAAYCKNCGLKFKDINKLIDSDCAINVINDNSKQIMLDIIILKIPEINQIFQSNYNSNTFKITLDDGFIHIQKFKVENLNNNSDILKSIIIFSAGLYYLITEQKCDQLNSVIIKTFNSDFSTLINAASFLGKTLYGYKYHHLFLV